VGARYIFFLNALACWLFAPRKCFHTADKLSSLSQWSDDNLKNKPENPDTLKGLRLLFPDYGFLVRIGSGAYGEIWLATAPEGQHRAIKFIAKVGSVDDSRYSREHRGIQLLKTLRDIPPGIVPILDVRENPQAGFGYVMELADAERPLWKEHPEEYRPKTLRGELVARRALPLAESLDIGIRLADALDFLQRHRLVHRDIKPSNIIYIQEKPVLADVGLLVDTREAESLVGTPGYVPREQHGHFSGDIYSLGILLTEISTGRPADEIGFSPVEESETDALGYARWLDILRRACETNPEKRYQTAAVLLHDLKEFQHNPSRRLPTRRKWLGFAAATVLFLAGMVGLLIHKWPAPVPPGEPTESPSIGNQPKSRPAEPSPQIYRASTTETDASVQPPQPHASTRTHFTIPDDAAQNGAFLKTYSDRILIGKGPAGNIADWRIAFYYRPIGSNSPALFLSRLTPFASQMEPAEPPLRLWPTNTPENAQIDGIAFIPPVILANHVPHNYPAWIFLTTNTPEKWESWMANNASILTNSVQALYGFQEAWHRQYRFAFEAPSGNPAYDKALEQIKQILGEELLRKTQP